MNNNINYGKVEIANQNKNKILAGIKFLKNIIFPELLEK